MKEYINGIVQELNSISRMAVIENATVTEHLICDYINILKYRWNEEEKLVVAAKEIEIVKRSCELYQRTSNPSFVYKIQEETDLKMVFIPHYTILSTVSTILEQVRGEEGKLLLTLEVKERNGSIKIRLLFEGPFPWTRYYEQIGKTKSSGYEDMNRSFDRWMTQFGKESCKVVGNQNALELCFYCQ